MNCFNVSGNKPSNLTKRRSGQNKSLGIKYHDTSPPTWCDMDPYFSHSGIKIYPQLQEY